ncbi:hypothetical protein ACFQ9X_49450 [Catenulispora yoronensis]
MITAGVQASDGTTTIHPGCCCELNDWRGWSDPDLRSEQWLGHSPQPWTEETAAGLAVHQDKEAKTGSTANATNDEPPQAPVLITTAELPTVLAALRADLIGFLGAAEQWATAVSGDPSLAAAVVANIDHHVSIRGPLAGL